MDERLLATCTRSLLEGWTGPVNDGEDWPMPAVCIGHFTEAGLVFLWTDGGDRMARPSDLSLDLSLAECRDRVARVIADRVGMLRDGAKPVCTAPDWTTRFDLPHWTMAGPQFGNGGGGSSLTWIPSEGFCPTLSALDPSDDTRLPDGSRLVDALALAAVWREVSRG